MKTNLFLRFASVAMLAVTGVLVDGQSSFGQRRSISKSQEAAENHVQVDLFAAMAAGQVEVQLIPKNAAQANVIITNQSDQPLAIRMPEAFAGVPVLAQDGRGGGGGAGGGGPGGGGGGGGANQGIGGGFGGGFGGGGFGGGGLGGGFFNLAPEKVGRVRVQTVCLEHGKKDPNPRVKYEIKPIESFTGNGSVIEMCKMIGRGEVSQNVAQAAAWHMANGLSWRELATKNRVQLSNGYFERWFSPQELQFAQNTVTEANRRSEQYDSRSVAQESNSQGK